MPPKVVPSKTGAQLRDATASVNGRRGSQVTAPPVSSGPRPPSTVADASAKVAAHQGTNSGSATPVTVGVNPNPPVNQLISQPDTLTSPTPAVLDPSTGTAPYGCSY